LRLNEGELVVSKMSTQTKLSGVSTTILGLALLSAGVFSIILFLRIPLGIFLISAGIVMTVIGVPLLPRKKIKRIPAVETVELEKPEEMQLCPQCNKKISKTFRNCPYCRFSLKTRVSICPSCGKRVPSHFKLCPYCREKLKD
jgi:hypothetical protein